jgi:gamma-glutamyltranspeptidase/glutathione hydrolase
MILVTFHLVVQNIYIVNEAKKIGFEDRAKYYADMNFVKVPVQQLLSKEYGDKRRELIDLDKSGTYQAGKVVTGTVYMTVADKEGNMVSNSKQLQGWVLEWFLNWLYVTR